MNVYMAALFAIGPKGNNTTCSSNGMGQQTVVYLCNGILFSNEKEHNHAIT